MSRSGYNDDCEDIALYRGQVASAIRGRRGQAFLRELVEALDALPQHALIYHELRSGNGVCALGAVGAKRGVNLESLDPDDADTLSGVFGIAHQLVREIEYENDEGFYGAYREVETPEHRWQRIRDWAVKHIRNEP